MYLFENVEKQQELRRVLKSWIGTPFRHRMAVKQRGCDCIQFVAAVFDEIGIVNFKRIKFPDYARDWHLHKTRQLLYDGIRQYVKVEGVGFNAPMIGDIMLFNFGKAAAHAAIFCDGLIYQSVAGAGVGCFDLKESQWWSKKVFNLRVLA